MPESSSLTERIRDLLGHERLAVGDRIPPERELAAQLGVSRPALREGLRTLVDLRVLERRQGSGTYLADLPLDDLFEVRMRLEPFAAELAARHRTNEEVAQMRTDLGRMGRELEFAERFTASDLKLHAAIAQASRNAVLETALSALAEMQRHSRRITGTSASLRAETLRDLAVLVDEIAGRRPEPAGEAMIRHLRRVRTSRSTE